MTSTEKIANAQKRINELERLINYWDNTVEKNIKSNDLSVKNEKFNA